MTKIRIIILSMVFMFAAYSCDTKFVKYDEEAGTSGPTNSGTNAGTSGDAAEGETIGAPTFAPGTLSLNVTVMAGAHMKAYLFASQPTISPAPPLPPSPTPALAGVVGNVTPVIAGAMVEPVSGATSDASSITPGAAAPAFPGGNYTLYIEFDADATAPFEIDDAADNGYLAVVKINGNQTLTINQVHGLTKQPLKTFGLTNVMNQEVFCFFSPSGSSPIYDVANRETSHFSVITLTAQGDNSAACAAPNTGACEKNIVKGVQTMFCIADGNGNFNPAAPVVENDQDSVFISNPIDFAAGASEAKIPSPAPNVERAEIIAVAPGLINDDERIEICSQGDANKYLLYFDKGAATGVCPDIDNPPNADGEDRCDDNGIKLPDDWDMDATTRIDITAAADEMAVAAAIKLTIDNLPAGGFTTSIRTTNVGSDTVDVSTTVVGPACSISESVSNGTFQANTLIEGSTGPGGSTTTAFPFKLCKDEAVDLSLPAITNGSYHIWTNSVLQPSCYP